MTGSDDIDVTSPASIDLSIGAGTQYAVSIECTPEQKTCVDQWLRAKGLVQFLDGLSFVKPSAAAVFAGTWTRRHKTGEGAKIDILIDCTHAQDMIIDAWFRAHDLAGFMRELGRSSRVSKPGEKRPCGCGD